MRLRGFEGFDNYAGQADLSANHGFIQYPPMGSFASISRPGRNNYGAALSVQSLLSTFGTFTPTFADRNSQYVFGIAAKTITGFSPPSDDSLIFLITHSRLGGQFVVQFRKTTGSVKIYGGDLGLGEFVPIGPVLYETANNVWVPDQWGYFEISHLIDPAAGYIRVQYTDPNGKASVLVDLENIRTQYVNGDNTSDSVAMGHPWFGTSDFLFDDMYYCDAQPGTGADNGVEFLGDMRVLTLPPTSQGSVGWTPLANTNWQEVSEPIFDFDSSYNSSSNPSDADLFYFHAPLFQTVSFIPGVQLKGAYRKDDAGPRSIQQFFQFSGQQTLGASHSLNDSGYVFFTDLLDSNPATGVAFKDLDILGMAAGYRLAA